MAHAYPSTSALQPSPRVLEALGRLTSILRRFRWLFVAGVAIAVVVPLAAYAYYGTTRPLPGVARPIAYAVFHVFSWSGLALIVIAWFNPNTGFFSPASRPGAVSALSVFRMAFGWAALCFVLVVASFLVAAAAIMLGT